MFPGEPLVQPRALDNTSLGTEREKPRRLRNTSTQPAKRDRALSPRPVYAHIILVAIVFMTEPELLRIRLNAAMTCSVKWETVSIFQLGFAFLFIFTAFNSAGFIQVSDEFSLFNFLSHDSIITLQESKRLILFPLSVGPDEKGFVNFFFRLP